MRVALLSEADMACLAKRPHLAMGTTCHGQGAARSLQHGEEAGAFAGMAMGMTAIAMAIVLALLAGLVP